VERDRPFTRLEARLTFLRKFFAAPLTIGSITPSSPFLTAKMLDPVPWGRVQAVAELGAGTGVFTRALAARLPAGSPALIFEQDPELRAHLKAAFPSFHHRADALRLRATVRELGLSGLDCILSSLPFGAFTQERRDRLIQEIVGALRPGGTFIQFQYSLQMLPQLREWFARVQVRFVPLNLPPAFVYTCQQLVS
jgi:phospholipid N-methyltransferase